MDKNTLIFIFILFLVSSQLWAITWSIGTALMYIVGAIVILNIVSPDSAEAIKEFVIKVVSLDSSLIINGLSGASRFVLNTVNSPGYKKVQNSIQETQKVISETISETVSETKKSVSETNTASKALGKLPVKSRDIKLPSVSPTEPVLQQSKSVKSRDIKLPPTSPTEPVVQKSNSVKARDIKLPMPNVTQVSPSSTPKTPSTPTTPKTPTTSKSRDVKLPGSKQTKTTKVTKNQSPKQPPKAKGQPPKTKTKTKTKTKVKQ